MIEASSSRPERSAVESPPHPAFRTMILFALALLTTSLHAQPNTIPTLSDAEVEQIREARYYPDQCILLFIKFLDLRVQEIAGPLRPSPPPRPRAGHPRPHRAVHRHRRRALRQPRRLRPPPRRPAQGPPQSPRRRRPLGLRPASHSPDNDAYNVSRKIALESIARPPRVHQRTRPTAGRLVQSPPPIQRTHPARTRTPHPSPLDRTSLWDFLASLSSPSQSSTVQL